MSDQTARLALPFIAPGQAQKELFHNEALARIDALLQPCVVAIAVDTPPADAVPGACWIVGEAPSGAWTDHPRALAAWTEGGWRFVAPVLGMTVWLENDSLAAFYDGTAWRIGEIRGEALMIGGVKVVGAQRGAIGPASGGAIVDAEARAAIAAVIAALQGHGLIAD